MKPSRRIPKAFVRKASPFARRVARHSLTKGTSRTRRTSLSRANRQWRRAFLAVLSLFAHFRLWLLSAVVLIVLSGVLYLFLSPAFTIRSISISRGDRRVDVEEIQMLMKPTFGRHILFLPPLLLSRDIQASLPEVASVEVRRIYPDELHIRLTMDPLAAKIHIGDPDDTEHDLQNSLAAGGSGTGTTVHRYLSVQGVYLEYPFPVEEGDRALPILHLVDWAVKPAHRQRTITPEVIKTIQQGRAVLEQSFGLTVPYVTVYLRAREFHVHTIHPGREEGNETLMLWFDQGSPIIEQINRYRAFLREVPAEAPSEYVDLRLHDRVVYK